MDAMKEQINIRTLITEPFVIGLILVAISIIPTLILGENGYVVYHDQLDGEITTYILLTKHYKESFIPEILGGVSKSSLVPASYGTLLMYFIFSKPFVAFEINQIFIQIIAYIGLFILLQEVHVNKWISLFTAVLFCILPFYSVYGLCVMGQPLFFYACYSLWKRQNWSSYVIGIVFALFSSPILVGYADCFLLLLAAIICKLRDRKKSNRLLALLGVLVSIYVLLYWTLVLNVSTYNEFISHRTEFAIQTTATWKELFIDLFFNGQYHAASIHSRMIPFVTLVYIIAIICLCVCEIEKEKKEKLVILVLAFSAIIIIALFYAFWRCKEITLLRHEVGGVLVEFQAERFYWLYPCLWFFSFGLSMDFLIEATGYLKTINISSFGIKILQKRRNIFSLVASAMCIIIFFFTGEDIYSGSFLKNNNCLINNADYTCYTYQKFFSTELFCEISDFIGRPQNEYKVGSVALYPAVPLYNGFYCIDGYSNNYDIKYKHRFRRIIEKELDKNESIREYYDKWGNRCYIFSGELGNKYFIPKWEHISLANLSLNHEALQELKCDYILSGVEIKNPSDSGLAFVKTFENSSSPYRIWLYKT